MAAHAAKEGLEGRFIEEWARFAPSFEAGLAGLGAKVRSRVPCPDLQRGSAAVKRRFGHATAMGRVLTAAERLVASKRRTTSDLYLSDACAKLCRIHLPYLPRPQASDKQALARYYSRALLASMNSTRKAALLSGLNYRISRAQQNARMYQKVMQSVKASHRAQRKTTFSKIRV